MAKRKIRLWSGARLRTLREGAGYTQAELAAAVGIYPHEVSNYERGKTEPSFSVLVRIAEALRVSLSDFAPTGDGRIDEGGE
ncbi:helix-turn-helix domain-containing protein [Urbifossiella limnaea]|uniref:helix-turn-helix domain-containing protein n=1 Tax=Urbifossiella limnaea TaxID=2528023 RepID=UPI0036F345DD